MSYIKEVVKKMGGQSALALKIGISQAAVWRWLQRGQAPAKYIYKISELTKNEITVEQLLSDHESKEES